MIQQLTEHDIAVEVVKDLARRILVIDSSRMALLAEATALARGDQGLRAVTTAGEALGIVRDWQPSLVLLAFDLTDMTAPDFCRVMRSAGSTRQLPILFMASAEDGPSRVDEVLIAGANDVVAKPLAAAEVDRKLELYLKIPTRASVRTLVKLHVEGRSDEELFLGSTLNLSSGGVLLESTRDIEMGTFVDLQFHLPLDQSPITARARVVRMLEVEGGKRHYGMRFEGLTAPMRARIAEYVARQS